MLKKYFKNAKADILDLLPRSKRDAKRFIFHILLIILGSFLLAFGTVIFLEPLNIVAGGLSGIAIIFAHFFGEGWFDTIILIAQWVLFFIGLIFLGVKFSFNTLVATIVYPLALMLFYRVPWFNEVLIHQIVPDPASTDTGMIILCGLFGGVFVGSGCALTFLGNGTTGGVDILAFIARKYLHIRQSIASFVIDATIIIFGMFLIPNNLVQGLVGVISAFVTALMIEIIYIKVMHTSLIAEIISTDWEEINRFLQDEVGRGTTIVIIKGGYKQEEHTMIKVVFSRREYAQIKEGIARIDPFAFVTYTSSEAVYGEGFQDHSKRKKSKRKK